MKNLIFYSFLLPGILFSQKLEWAASYEQNDINRTPATIAVSSDKVVAVSGILEEPNVVGDNRRGLFIQLSDSLGNLLWKDFYKADGFSRDAGVCFSKNGELYMAGYFGNSFMNNGAPYPGGSFIAKYDKTGNRLWLKSYPTFSINNLFFDQQDRLLVLLSFEGTIQYHGENFTAKKKDVVLACLDSNDHMVYSRQLSGITEGIKVRTGLQGNVFIFGGHEDTLYYQGSVLNIFTTGSYLHYVVKLDPLGSVQSFTYGSNQYWGTSDDFSCNSHEQFAISSHYCYKGCWSYVDLFEPSGLQVSTPQSSFSQYFRKYWEDMKLAFHDTDAVWALYDSHNYTGNYYMPDSTWTTLLLSKIDWNHKVIMIHELPFQGRGTAITTDHNGAVYVASSLPENTSVQLQHQSLANNDKTYHSLFVAKYWDDKNLVDLPDRENAEEPHIFPNPATQNVTIKKTSSFFGAYVIELVNVLGECQLRKMTNEMSRGEVTLDVREVPPGLYTLIIQGEDKRLTKKLVIRR